MTRLSVYGASLAVFIAGTISVSPRPSRFWLFPTETDDVVIVANTSSSLPASAMTLASILVPHWVSMDVPVHGSDKTYSQHLGLHHYCNTALPDKPCRTFPEEDKDCSSTDKYFCSMWRTSGFLMSFATIAELATLVCFVVTIGGGKVKREYGWKVLSGLLATVSVVQFAAMGLVVCSLFLVQTYLDF